jgi:hypothetical protein
MTRGMSCHTYGVQSEYMCTYIVPREEVRNLRARTYKDNNE